MGFFFVMCCHDDKNLPITCLMFPSTMCYKDSLAVNLLLRDVFFKCLDSVEALQTVYYGKYLSVGIGLWILVPL